MDAAGAEILAWSIEQQGHWCQAESVLDGRQPPRDPDRESLVSVGDGIRVYAEKMTRSGSRLRLCMRLVDGASEPGAIEDPPTAPADPARA
jgi:hypothetical protein